MTDGDDNVHRLDPRIELQIAKLELQEGDILIAQAREPRDPSVLYGFSRDLASMVPKGCKVMVIPGDVQLTKITKKQVDALAMSGSG